MNLELAGQLSDEIMKCSDQLLKLSQDQLAESLFDLWIQAQLASELVG